MSYGADTFKSLIIRFSLLLVNLAGGIINARWLGPEGLGIYVLLNMVSQFSFRFGNLGMGTALAFFMANKKASFNDLKWIIWCIGSTLSLASCLILLFIWENTLSPWHDIRARLFYLSLLTVPLSFFRNFMVRFLSGQLKIKIINKSLIIFSFSYVFMQAFWIILLKLGVLGALISFVLAQIIVCFYLLTVIKERKTEVEKEIKEIGKGELVFRMWRYGRWNYLEILSTFVLNRLPTLFLKIFVSNSAIGIFSLAYTLLNRMSMLTNTFSMILFPYTAASERDIATERTNFLCRTFLLIMIVLAFLMLFLIQHIIFFLYGSEFQESVHAFYALLPTLIIMPLYRFSSTHIAASGNSKLSFLLMLPGVVSCCILGLVFIPEYGSLGASLSISGAFTVLFFVHLIIYSRVTKSTFSELLLYNRTDWSRSKKILQNQYALTKKKYYDLYRKY